MIWAGAEPAELLPSAQPDPYAPDLLMPIRLAQFSSSQSALAGRLTLVGKVLLAVHKAGDDFVDVASLQQWSGARSGRTASAATSPYCRPAA